MHIGEKIPPSTKRVQLHTNHEINEKIKQKTINNIANYKDENVKDLTKRLKQLNREWDTERILEANAATIIFVSTILGIYTSRYWFILVGIVSFFLLQHAVQGWCPPLPVIRRLGVRSPEEIAEEKTAIKFLRGDFTSLSNKPKEIMEAAKKG